MTTENDTKKENDLNFLATVQKLSDEKINKDFETFCVNNFTTRKEEVFRFSSKAKELNDKLIEDFSNEEKLWDHYLKSTRGSEFR